MVNRRILFLLGASGILFFAIWSFASDGILGMLLRSGLTATERIELVREYFLSWGAAAPVVYVVVVIIEVIVAPIPGLMLYAPGGVIFGGFYGGILSLVGNVIGAGLAAAFMQSFREWGTAKVLRGEKIKPIIVKLQDSGVWVILALRINPLTTSDLVSYAAGLAGIPVWKVMLGTAVGMAPLCLAQSYLAEGLFEAVPWLLYPLMILSLIYVVIALYFIRRTLSRV
jgi:uncharacterized membrane protein YdjX (TVP38/TMEM64 family)